MSESQSAAAAGTTTTEAGVSFLDQVMAATKQTPPDQAQDLVKTLVEQALSGTVTFDKNLSRTFDQAIAAIDRKLSQQLNAIEDFEPARVAAQVPALQALMETRAKLRDLMSKVDRSEELEGLLEQVLKNETDLKSLGSQLGLDKQGG